MVFKWDFATRRPYIGMLPAIQEANQRYLEGARKIGHISAGR